MMPDSGSEIYVRTEEEDLVVEARAVRIGADILVYIWGGDRPHIGAVAAAQPRPSLADQNRRSATCSVLTYLGHKEDEVVKSVSEHLSAALDTHVVVTAGIHWDNLNHNEIGVIGFRIEEITRQLTAKLQKQERVL
jgi:gallate decarboxylase subunit D